MMTWGFPCTDISVAGNQKGFLDENGNKTRSGMYYEGIRILRYKQPKFSIIENVKNLTSKRFKSEFEMVLSDLNDAGYNSYYKVLNSKDYGIPQNRERVFIVSIRKDIDNGQFKFPEPFNSRLRLKDFLEDSVDEKFYINEEKTQRLIKNINDKELNYKGVQCIDKSYNSTKQIEFANCLTAREDRGISNRKSEGTAVLECIGNINPSGHGMNGNVFSENGLAPTLTTNNGEGNKIAIRQATTKGNIKCEVGGVADLSYQESKTRRGRVQEEGNICPTLTATQMDVCKIESPIRIRKLTPKECFRLQGFSDKDFDAVEKVVSNSQLYKQAGNSITVDVLYYILVELYKAMPYLFNDLKLGSFFSGIGAFESALDRLYEGINSGNFTIPQVE